MIIIILIHKNKLIIYKTIAIIILNHILIVINTNKCLYV